MQEPRDGDFVAYIDALQRESAARLAQQHVNVVDVAFPTKGRGTAFEEKPAPAATPDAVPGTGGFVRRDRDAKLAKTLVAGVIGAAFLLTWLGSGGPFSFIVGVALLAYALPRLLAAFRAQVQQPANKTMIERVFGRSGSETTGRGK